MKHTMRILTFLMLAIVVGTGHAWAATDGPSNIKKGTVSNGSIEFYADEACTTSFDTDVAVGATVYVKATAAPGYTAIGVTFTATKGIGTNLIQAPRRIGIASDIAVSAVTGKPDIYSFTMPEDVNFTVTVNATFAMPEQQQVSYVDGSYETKEVNAYVLDETMHVLPTGFYVVPEGVLALDNQLNISGNVNLILADGCQMSATTISGSASQLTIYAQTGGQTGQMVAAAYDCGVAFGQRFVVYNAATGTAASAIVSGSNSDANATFTLDGIAGKTLRPLDGNYVIANPDVFTFSGSTSLTSPFTITTGEGENETTTHYYICKKDDPVTLSYAGSDFVMLSGLPEGTTLAAVEGQPMQRSFAMPAGDVELTTTSVTGLTATPVIYDGTAQTPEIKQGDDVFAPANYTIAYQLGEGAVAADDVKNANTYTCTLTGLGQYVGTTTVPFAITKRTTSLAVEIVDPVTTIDGHPVLIAGDDAHVKVTLVPVKGENETTELPAMNGIATVMMGTKTYTVAIVNGVGHYYVANLAQDAYAITASYDGDANHAASTTENATTLEVCKILTETTCSLDKTEINVGEAVNATVNVNEVGLQRPVIDDETDKNKEYHFASSKPLSSDVIVTIKCYSPEDNALTETGPNNFTLAIINGQGIKTFSHIPAGPRTVTAIFAGNDRYTDSVSIIKYLQVNKTETTIGVSVTSPVIAK